MPTEDLALVSHLLRRAGFGASRTEVENYAQKEYEEIVEDLLTPEKSPEYDADFISRYYMGTVTSDSFGQTQAAWIYRMINTPRPLEERMTLFWHHLFATGWNKHEHAMTCVQQIDMFRTICLADMTTILTALSKDPNMICWLDNSENHKNAPNENYGREIMELFSMGVGNYSEDDIKNAARAFTGWTFTQCIPLYPFGTYLSEFEFREDDHDYSEKTFLGEVGNFDGYDIIDIIVKQSATAKFISRHLYNFFVADEPQVPAWSIQPPRDPKAIEMLANTFIETKGNIREVLRTLFNSDFFKNSRFMKIKSPVDFVVGTVKIAGSHTVPQPDLINLSGSTALMGQTLMDPPTVESWHTGPEWIDSGTLTDRVNFAVEHIGDLNSDGIKDIINRIKLNGEEISPEELVNISLELLGNMEIDDTTRKSLLEFSKDLGVLIFDTTDSELESSEKIINLLQMIVSCREYQFA